MKIEQLMCRDLKSCSPNETLDCAARIMWECDCGVVPVVDANTRVVGMITDRDICMAAFTMDRRLSEIPISRIGLKPVVAVKPSDTPQTAEALMQRHQVRRLAVIDDNGRLVGVLSLNDLARRAGRNRDLPSDDIVATLAAISRPRNETNAMA